MAAPTESFTSIPVGDTDPDSPVTTGLMLGLANNDKNLSSQLIGETSPFTAAQKHDHDGDNSKLVVGSLNFQAVGQGLTHTLSNASSDFVLVDISGFAESDTGGAAATDAMWTIIGDLQLDLTAFTMTGVGTMVVVGFNTTSGQGVTTDHNATSLPDDTFVTFVSLALGSSTITAQIKFNRSTDVITIQVTGATGTGAASDLGMRVLEFVQG